MAKVAEKALGRVERQSMATFYSMIMNGNSFNEALTAISPVLDDIIKKHKDLGTEAGAGIKELLKIREVTAANQELMDAIDGNLAVMNALAVSGSLDQQVLTDAATSASDYYNQLVTAGLSGNQALTMMAPTLEQLRFLSKEHNLELDATTQALIDQATQSGVLGAEQVSMQDTLTVGFNSIVLAIGQIPVALQEMIAAMQRTQDALTAVGDESDSTWDDMQQNMSETSDAADDLQDSLYGSGVGGALEKIQAMTPGVFGGLISKIDETTKSVRGLEDGLIGIDVKKVGDSIEEGIKKASDMKGIGDELISLDPEKMTDKMKKQLDVFRYETEKNKIDLGGLIGLDPNEVAGNLEEGIRKAGEIGNTGVITDMLITSIEKIPERFDDMIGGLGTTDIFQIDKIPEQIEEIVKKVGEGGIGGIPITLEGGDALSKLGKTAKIIGDLEGGIIGINPELISAPIVDLKGVQEEATKKLEAKLDGVIDVIKEGMVAQIDPVVIPNEKENIIKFVITQFEKGNIKIPSSAIQGNS
jgi:hypothetical protein